MADVGSLTANLELETAAFRKEMDKAVNALNSNAAKMNKTFVDIERRAKQMNVVVGGFLTVWAGSKAIAAINNALALADNIGKQAQNVGMSARSYQELIFAQEQLGGTQESINKAMLQFNRIIGDAANGNKKAVEALKLVGIATEDLKSQSIEQLYVRATTTLGTYTDSARRAAAIQKNFGDEALKTATAFAVNAKELEGLRAAAHSAGVVLDESTIASAEKTKDEMEKLSKVISIQLTQAFVQWAPLLVKATKFIAELGEMATWAARKIGLLNNVTLEQQYQALLEKRLDTTERIAFLESKMTPGTIGGTMRAELEQLQKLLPQIDKELGDLRAKMLAPASKDKKPAGSSDAPAVTGDVKAVTGADTGFSKLMAQLRKDSAKLNDDLQTDEAERIQRAMQHIEQEYRFRANAAQLSAQQRKQFEEELYVYLANKEIEMFAASFEREEAKKQQLTEQFEQIRAQYDERFAIEEEYENRKLELQQLYRELNIQDKTLYDQLEVQFELEKQARLGSIFAEAEVRRRQVAQMNWQGQLNYAQQSLGTISQMINSESKSQFEIGKKAAIAQATIAAITSAIESYKSASAIPFVGWILGPIAAAAALAVGMANVNKIKSTQFGGGGGGASFGGGGLSASASAPSAPAGQPAEIPDMKREAPARNVNITFRKSTKYSAEEIRDEIMPEIADAMGDRVNLTVATVH